MNYDSQIDSEMAGLIAEFARRYDGRERIWANAAWCELETLSPQAPVAAVLTKEPR